MSQKGWFLRHCSAAILEAAPAFLLFDKTDPSSGRKDHGISGHINYLSAPDRIPEAARQDWVSEGHPCLRTNSQELTIDVLMILTLSGAPSAQRLGQLVVDKVPPSSVITYSTQQVVIVAILSKVNTHPIVPAPRPTDRVVASAVFDAHQPCCLSSRHLDSGRC